MTFNSEDEKKRFITEIIDKLLYCDGFHEDLSQLMKKYEIPSKVKVSHQIMNFNHKK